MHDSVPSMYRVRLLDCDPPSLAFSPEGAKLLFADGAADDETTLMP